MTVWGNNLFTSDHMADLLFAFRAVQIPLLAALLLGACAAKARRAIFRRSIEAGIGPTAMFPAGLRRPIAIALFAGEFALGIGLVATAGRFGTGPPAVVVRSATALLFAMAVAALHELRGRHPDAGCGCFGDLSHTPVSWQAVVRSALLCGGAIASIGVVPLHLPTSGRQAAVVLAVLVAELLVLAAVSPEVGEIMVRLGYSEPCEVRRLPVSRTLGALRSSSHWRRYKRYLVAPDEPPIDVWREGCWRYVVFQGMLASRRVEIVFAVYLKPHRAAVRAGIYDATADRRSRESADGPPDVLGGGLIPAPRPAPVPVPVPPLRAAPAPHGRPAPVVLSVKAAPHGPAYRMSHPVAHQAHHRHRHSADL
jgi:methylamine utilization protein MauE